MNSKLKIQNFKFAVLVSAMLFALCVAAHAQQQTKVARIGYLTGASLSSIANRMEPFRQGLRDLGYVEGKNIVIEWRGADGNSDRQRALATELVRLKVEVIVTAGPGGTRAAKEATSTIPLVMTQDPDPVAPGSSPAWRDQVGTLLGSPGLRQS